MWSIMRLLPSPFPDTNLNLVDLGAQINLKIVHGWDFNLMAATPVGEQASHCTTLAPIYIVQTGNTHIPHLRLVAIGFDFRVIKKYLMTGVQNGKGCLVGTMWYHSSSSRYCVMCAWRSHHLYSLLLYLVRTSCRNLALSRSQFDCEVSLFGSDAFLVFHID